MFLLIYAGRCLPYGLLDVSDCYYGFPIALSYPHFLDCDESLAANIIGTQPNRSQHETYFMIQPVSKQLYLSHKMFFRWKEKQWSKSKVN